MHLWPPTLRGDAMNAWLIIGAVIAYCAVGAGLARLWAWFNLHPDRYYEIHGDHELRGEMVATFALWPILLPLFLLAQLLRWAIFPERMR